MSMTKDVIRKFVEQDYKDCTILITCDNEHLFYHNTSSKPNIVWDWDNGVFLALEVNDQITDQSGHPMQVTSVALEEIQFLTAYIDPSKSLEFINNKFTNNDEKEKCKAILSKARPAMMGPRTLKLRDSDQWGKKDN